MPSTASNRGSANTVVAGALTIAGSLTAVLAALTLPAVVGVTVGVALVAVGMVARRDRVTWVVPVTCWSFGALCVALALTQGVHPGS